MCQNPKKQCETLYFNTNGRDFGDRTSEYGKKKQQQQQKHRKEPLRDPRAERLLGTDHYFLRGGGGLENFDLNCLQRL